MSRYAKLSRTAAAGVLALLASLIVLGLFSLSHSAPTGPVTGSRDLSLYRSVVERVRQGQSYEAVAIDEQRARGYPLKPFVVVRPPALATVLSRLPSERTGDVLLALLATAVICAWSFRLQAVRGGPLWLAGAALVVFTGAGASMAGGGASLFHESWAGLLMALSLALRTKKRFTAAVLVGLAAALVRELALPYLVVMALLALTEKRRFEAGAFAAALAFALAALALHAQAVTSLTTAHDPSSQGWAALGGWGFVLATAKWNLLALAAGPWAAAAIVPLALVGAGGWKDAAGLRLTVLLTGYTLGFMAIGRPENSYWGLLVAPLIAVGLCFAPMALSDLLRRTAGANSASHR